MEFMESYAKISERKIKCQIISSVQPPRLHQPKVSRTNTVSGIDVFGISIFNDHDKVSNLRDFFDANTCHMKDKHCWSPVVLNAQLHLQVGSNCSHELPWPPVTECR